MGFAGARIDDVALAAGVNKRMIYHYFQNKDGLYEAVLDRRLSQQAPQGEAEDFAAALEGEFDPEVLRLMAWEALTTGADTIVAESVRTRAWQRLIRAVVRKQDAGELRADLDPRQLTLALLAVRIFPRIFTQYSKMILDHDPQAPDSAAGLDRFFRDLLKALGSPTGGMAGVSAQKPRVRLKPASRSAG